MTYQHSNKAKLHTNINPFGHNNEPLLTEADKKLIANEISSAVRKGVGLATETPELKSMREVVAKHHGHVIANQLNPEALKSMYEQVTGSGGGISTNSRYRGAPDFEEYLAGNFSSQTNNVPNPKDYLLED